MTDLFTSPCPGALMHGPPDRAGRCPWCGQKVDRPLARPKVFKTDGPSDLTQAYDEFYDPDFGGLTKDELDHRYLMGLRS